MSHDCLDRETLLRIFSLANVYLGSALRRRDREKVAAWLMVIDKSSLRLWEGVRQ